MKKVDNIGLRKKKGGKGRKEGKGRKKEEKVRKKEEKGRRRYCRFCSEYKKIK